MEVEEETPARSEPVEAAVDVGVVDKTEEKKRKKKKTSYKNMMANMTTRTKEEDILKERESLRKVTGGGAFSKIDRI